MNRATVAALAAFEAVITAAIGIGIALAPLTIVWAVQYRMAVSWAAFWQASADAWLVGHGVDLSVHLSAATAASIGLGGAVPRFAVTLGALGIALFTITMGARVGRRAAETPFVLVGGVTTVVVFGGVAQIVAVTARSAVVAPSLGQAGLAAAATVAVGFVLGAGLHYARNRDAAPEWLVRSVPAEVRLVGGAALRAGIAAVALVLAASAVLVALTLFGHFGQVVALYEALQSGYLGGTTLTLAQLAVLPNAVVWAASWLIGPGFAAGGGTVVAPGGAGAGALPGIPLLAIVPTHAPAIAFVGVLVPLLAAAAAGYLTFRRLRAGETKTDAAPAWLLPAIAVASGVVAAVVFAVLAAWSGGTLAPGSLAGLGPDPWLLALVAGLEVAVGTAAGLYAARYRGLAGRWVAVGES